MCTLVSKNPLGLLRCQHIQEQQDWQVGYRAAMKARIDESEQEWERPQDFFGNRSKKMLHFQMISS